MIADVADGLTIGPVLIGMAKSTHVFAQVITLRNLVNMRAVVVEHAMR